ncbi:uncharacterized protein LOC134821735 [Bolinopsis microptera]|uniref:uncharacterized protein LOC134821735 n=1 Tax=Bolinopsis microptera TaxID=2820187 RepID=UPI00307A417A
MAKSAHMEGPKNVHSLIGGLAQALKGFSMPRSSTLISEELKKLSDEIKKEKKYSCSSTVLTAAPSQQYSEPVSLPSSTPGEDSSATVFKRHSQHTFNYENTSAPSLSALSTPSCSTAQIDYSNGYDVADHPNTGNNVGTNFGTHVNHFPNNSYPCQSRTISPSNSSFPQTISPASSQIHPNSDTDILYHPESLLKLLSDDSDFIPDSTEVSRESHCNFQPSEQDPSLQCPTGTAILRLPEYIKAPARIFPLVIGSETYGLPYQDNGSTVAVTFNVVHAAGEFVVAKVTGCGPFDTSAPNPGGIILTLADEIKVLHNKSVSEMTIDEQIQYHSLKEEQNEVIAESIKKFNQQQRNSTESASGVTHPEQTKNMEEDIQYLNVGSDVVGTVVKVPEGDSLGLISCEINDDFITVPFTALEIPMVGGETVLFDLELNCKTKKTEAKRVKLAPLDTNLKNEKNTKLNGMQRKKSRNVKDRHLPMIASPPSTFSPQKITKCGMVGKIMSLPTKNRDGVIKLYVEKHYTRADFKLSTCGDQFRTEVAVQFDLNVWFDTSSPFEAVNVKLADKDVVVGRYSLQSFICEELPDGKHWSLEDFKRLLLLLRESATQSYDWKSMSQSLKRSQGDIKNFLHIFVMKINKTTDPALNGTYNKQQLDKFVSNINQIKTTKRHNVCNNENVPLSERRRSRTSSAKETPVPKTQSKLVIKNGAKKASGKEKPPSPKTFTELKSNKRPKLAPAPPVPMVDSISKSDSVNQQTSQTTSSHFSPHQSFVAKNLQSWSKVPEVPGDQAVNSVLGDVFSSCGEHTSQPMSSSGDTSEADAVPDLGAVYRYIGALLANEKNSKDIPVKLNEIESKIVVYLLQDLFDDMSKRNLLPHKQFLLQRYFDFTGTKTSGRTPINPFKLKGFLLHLPEPQTQRGAD